MDPISFDDTAIAFAHNSDKELRQSKWLFSMMANPIFVKLGTRLTPWSIEAGLPVKGLIRKTIFRQFVGGETLEETIPVVEKLARYHVGVILDYGVEGKEGEDSYDHARDEFIRVIRFAGAQKTVPFISVKFTGMARFSLLEKLDASIHKTEGATLQERLKKCLLLLSSDELNEWTRLHERVDAVCQAARDAGVGFLVDAEESWIQDPIDALTMEMMEKYNRERVIIYNTIQLYRHDRLAFLQESFTLAEQRGYVLGAKLVRGAYMEKERRRAAERGEPSPIQPDKASSDRDYNEAVAFCIEHIDRVGTIVATHNEESNLFAVSMLLRKGLPMDHAHIHFSQLYGMSDNITFNLAKAGCSVSKYLPFGPIRDVVPYLMRRAQENTSVGGQTTRELSLLKKEMARRSS